MSIGERILPYSSVFDVHCESRNCREVENLLGRALSTWKALVDAVNGDADECDEHWTTRNILKRL